MKRLLAALALPVICIPLLISTSAVQALPIITVTYDFYTSPTTDITSTTAVFHGKGCLSFDKSSPPITANEAPSTLIFKYGTSPGSLNKWVNAEVVSAFTEANRLCFTCKATVSNLSPCDQYYVQLHDNIGPIPIPIKLKIINHPGTSFSTTGCQIGAIGQGGIATGLGTSSSSALPVSAPVQMASIAVQDAKVGTPMVSPGQSVDIAASVTNKGSASGDAKVTLYVNGEPVESKGITVAAGQTAPVHFQVDRNEPGTYTVHVNSIPAGSFTVDMFSNNDTLIYSIIALLVLGISGTLFFLLRNRSA